MADYFVSDVHLRLDKPDRAQRFARFVEGLTAADRLWVVGDLCDFWFASRERDIDPSRCEGLASLVRFRARQGALAILLGNHDAWLGPNYERWFGLTITPEPHRVTSYGFRIVMSHGHKVRSKARWKAFMESRAFLQAFQYTPDFVARGFDKLLASVNERTRARAETAAIAEYRVLADGLADCDLAIFGHTHRVHDDPSRPPRLIVIGDWVDGTAFVRLDDTGIIHHASPLV